MHLIDIDDLLDRLMLANNQIASIEPAATMVGLRSLDVSNNEIADISPLLRNSGLELDDVVAVRDNPYSCEEQAFVIESLEARGVVVLYSCQ